MKALGRKQNGGSGGGFDILYKRLTRSTERTVLVERSSSLHPDRLTRRKRTTPRNGGNNGQNDSKLNS